MLSANIKIINELKTFVQEKKQSKEFFSSPNDFSRERQLNFELTIYFLINLIKKSLSVELIDFFNILGLDNLRCSKSAFCQQRKKLSYKFFAYWNTVLVNSFYTHYANNVKRWKGFRLIAVDGSTAYLLNKPGLISHFGVQSNQSVDVAMARIMGFYDVLNELSIGSFLLPIGDSEQATLNKCISYYESDMLFLYDRGFASFASIYMHLEQEMPISFVIRCKEGFNTEVIAFGKEKSKSKIAEFKSTSTAIKELAKFGYIITSKTTVKVRLVKIKLGNGVTEILITNLYDETAYPNNLFKELYFKRWKIETNYGTQKNNYQLECFSGYSVNSILQDFYANIFIANLHSIISKSGESIVHEKTNHRKYEYKQNKNVAIGMLKNRIVSLFMSKDPTIILKELIILFAKNNEPIRPNRSFKRVVKRKRTKGKYQTLTNYKRAI